jgi:hypothetical protein
VRWAWFCTIVGMGVVVLVVGSPSLTAGHSRRPCRRDPIKPPDYDEAPDPEVATVPASRSVDQKVLPCRQRRLC